MASWRLAIFAVIMACSLVQKADVPIGCDRIVYGACVIFADDAPDISQERLEEGFRVSAALWGTLPAALRDFTVMVRGPDAWKLADDTAVWGVTYMLFPRMDFSTPLPTCPELVLAHEWGHAGARIEGHEDPRFSDSLLVPYLHAAGLKGC